METKFTTPKKITDVVIDFCAKVVPNTKPFYIEVHADEMSVPGECYQNVNDFISINGGVRRLGWNIWQRKNAYLEAEAHAIWQDKDGQYIDISPHSYGENKILFLPDSSMQYYGKFIKSKRHALTTSPLVADLIQTIEKIEDIIANAPGKNYFTPPQLMCHYLEVQSILDRKAGRNDPCPCQSGVKHKWCCGQY